MSNREYGECSEIFIPVVPKKDHVPSELEKKIQELISTEFKDSTMMTIAHRLNTIMGCDKVMVLSYGMLAEFDSPSNLM